MSEKTTALAVFQRIAPAYKTTTGAIVASFKKPVNCVGFSLVENPAKKINFVDDPMKKLRKDLPDYYVNAIVEVER